ncbi:hypothetical protein M501DRAFT_932154 [Patellaria atrata CBS 101060]|uniref:DNA recombination and repair protein Rad51-like C-terminal domain-containing protein n=1 Tax=Patellaria atrata CBS 101060 TaxID=1346257 RepID=A0A9P4SCT9_9PEZI|nr:hypothetical protein M501DRAFT_932154 [Patellaria atrata CBS 101060]
MNAEELGRRLLGEVEEAGMEEILTSLRFLASPFPHSSFDIPSLDRLLASAQAPPGPQVQQAQAPGPCSSPTRPSTVIIPSHSLPKTKAKPPIIELTSTAPGSGKTQLLYFITALATLPPLALSGISLYGKSAAVVVIDTDGHFSVPRLVEVMKAHISRCKSSSQPHSRPASSRSNEGTRSIGRFDMMRMIKEALTHVHIFRVTSPSSLLATIESLSTYLFDTNAHHSGNRAVHSIILDSVTAFHYLLPPIQPSHTTNESTPKLTSAQFYQSVLSALKTVQQTFSCNILYTSVSLPPARPSNTTNSTPSHIPANLPRSLLPISWYAFPTLRLLLARENVPPVAPAMSVQEARRDRDARQSVVERGGFGMIALSAGRGELGESVGFYVRGEEGVVFEEDGTEEAEIS